MVELYKEIRRTIGLRRRDYYDVKYLEKKFKANISDGFFKLDFDKIDHLSNNYKNYKGESAVVFLVDRKFYNSFFTLLYSLEKTKSFIGLPKIVLTIEDEIYKNGRIQEVADEVIKINIEDYPELQETKQSENYTFFHRPFIPNITFLKFFIHKVSGYKKLLFLDSDIICLNNADAIFAETIDKDMAVSPVIDSKIYFKNGNKLDLDAMDRAYRMYFEKPNQKLINSGVIFLNEKCIGIHIFKLLISLAQRLPYPSDQDVLNRFIQLCGNSLNVSYLPPWYNITRPTFDYLGEEIFLRDFEKLKFHHYSGPGGKPWDKKRGSSNYNFLDQVWYDFYEGAKSYYDL